MAAVIPLPIAGCLADVPPEVMAEQERRLTDVIRAWGCPMERPLIFLMFLEIVPLPFYALTEHGMVDFLALQYLDPVLERVA